MVSSMARDVYESPLSARYADKEMKYLFSPDMKFRTWRKLWIALAETEMELGLPVTQEQIDELKAHAGDINYDVAQAREKEVRHDVMSHVYAYGQQCPKAAGIIHWGATSCYVGDNTDVIIMTEALQLIRNKLVGVIRVLSHFAQEYKDLPTLAFTHFQPAQPTTVGKRATLWIQDLLMDLEDVEYQLGKAKLLGSKGTTGTQASFLELFEGDHQKCRQLDEKIAQKMGYDKCFPVSGQTYSRKLDSQMLNILSGIAQSAAKFSNDIRLLQHLKEVEELGFVPNGSFGNGRKSFDRSQPPVGTMCVWEVYKLDKDEEFLKEAFDLLLRWNRWWMEKRYNGGLLSWGSDDYDNKWEMDGIHETFGASLESGMDNSPMYIPEEVYFNPEKNILELWDVALNSMYIYDCEHLADIAGILGRNEEKELRERAEAFKKLFPRLWNEELGIYCNYKTDEQKFSTVLSPCNFYALMTGLPDDRQAERMMKEHFMNPEEFYGDWIMPSIARNHPMYPENTYWRGRIWAPLNFLVYMGMRRYEGLPETRILVDKSMELFMKEWTEHGHVHENYNSENGYGDDVLNSDRNYAWGGLLVLMTLMEEGLA